MRRFVVGARGSRLSCLQTEAALALLRREFPGTDYRLMPFSTPGDRDLTTPIERSAPDFFTRDLDDAVRQGRIDFAIHSAKDLPSLMADDLDWFWLPMREDPRDAWVTRKLPPGRRRTKSTFRIGVSSERRAAYAKKIFPKAKLLPIRGAVDARLELVRNGTFDAVLMAMAGLRRLCGGGLPEGVEVTPIPLDELTPPEAQGYLAVVFKAGNKRLMAMRQRFVKAVRFVSAGVGDAGLCTIAGQRDISSADIVLHDALLGQSPILNPQSSIFVGKRCGAHSMSQAEITRRICDEARKGRRVVRLKGGDAGLFGRLAEETDALAALEIPFIVRPGVSALTAATTGTGILLTRRGESRGFTAYTPRSTGTELPQVLFMSLRVAAEEARRLRKEGWPSGTPCAFVFDAAGPREEVVQTTLGKVKSVTRDDRPGVLIVGQVAAHRWPALGELAGRRVLLTCSDAVQEKAARTVEDRGGRPIRWPLIRLVPKWRAEEREFSAYDGIVLTSPSAVRIFFESCPCDRRQLPEFFTCGAGTDAELRKYGIASDVMPAADFSAAGLIAEIRGMDLRGRRILRLRSAKAGPDVAHALKRAGARVNDVVLYDNEFCAPADKLPPFDDVFFASASAVESFLAQYGASKLRGKGIYVMGAPTRAAVDTARRRYGRIKAAQILTLN